MPQIILRPIIGDGDTDVVFLYELFYSRQSFWSGIAGDDHANSCALAIFELGADVRIFIFGKIDGSGSVEFYSRRGIVPERSRLLLRIHRKMILDVLRVQVRHV